MSLVAFYTSWKHKKPRGFPIFSGGIEEIIDMKRIEFWTAIEKRQFLALE